MKFNIGDHVRNTQEQYGWYGTVVDCPGGEGSYAYKVQPHDGGYFWYDTEEYLELDVTYNTPLYNALKEY